MILWVLIKSETSILPFFGIPLSTFDLWLSLVFFHPSPFCPHFIAACVCMSLQPCQSRGKLCSLVWSLLPFAVFNMHLECATSHLMLSNNTDLSTSQLLSLCCRVKYDPQCHTIQAHGFTPLPVPGHLVSLSSCPIVLRC